MHISITPYDHVTFYKSEYSGFYRIYRSTVRCSHINPIMISPSALPFFTYISVDVMLLMLGIQRVLCSSDLRS